MNIANYYLDLKKVSELPTEDERHRIHSYYKDLLGYIGEVGLIKQSQSIFNTLEKGGFLIPIEVENEVILS